MSAPPPVYCQWDGENFVPLPQSRRPCNAHFVVGMNYPLVVHEQRSRNSHAHFFAALHDAWLNLPELLAEQFPTDEHLRKWALIKAGFANERSIVCASKAEAQRIAAFIRPIDPYALIDVRGATIREYTAQSQSLKAMGKADFQASKQAVLEVVAALCGIEVDTLSANTQSPSIAPGLRNSPLPDDPGPAPARGDRRAIGAA